MFRLIKKTERMIKVLTRLIKKCIYWILVDH